MSLSNTSDPYGQFRPLLLEEELNRLIKLRSIYEEKQHFTSMDANFRLQPYLEQLFISFQLLPNATAEVSQCDDVKDQDDFSGTAITGTIFTHADVEFIAYTLRWRRDADLYFIHDLAFGATGDSDAAGRLFVEEVLRWQKNTNWYISVFQRGAWYRDAAMWDAIQTSRWDKIMLDDKIVKDLQRDCEIFLDSKALYDDLGLVWRREILLLGPSGNGKTETIKILLKECGRPTFYVKSFIDGYDNCNNYNDCIRVIFEVARDSAPCVLILEGIHDLLKIKKSRAFFLNELDSLTCINGILVIGTSEQIQVSSEELLLRPSRFQRKYELLAPDNAVREKYLIRWLEKARQRGITFSRPEYALVESIVELTRDWSFALLEELFVSFFLEIKNCQLHSNSKDISPIGSSEANKENAEMLLFDQISCLAKQVKRPRIFEVEDRSFPY